MAKTPNAKSQFFLTDRPSYERNPADGIAAIENPNTHVPDMVVPVYELLSSGQEDGPLTRPAFFQLTDRFSRCWLLLDEHYHLNSGTKRDLVSDESKKLVAGMAKKPTERKKGKANLMKELRGCGVQSWSVKLAILSSFEKARGRHREVHPPCKTTWSTPTNYITYGEKVGILFALTNATDTTALDTAAGAGGSRLKGRMEDLLNRWKYVLFLIELPKTEDPNNTFNVTLLPNQSELEYSCNGTAKGGARNFEIADHRHVLVVPRFTALKTAESPRTLANAFGTPKSQSISRENYGCETHRWIQ